MADETKCQWCGQIHMTVCFMVKALEYFPDGTIKRVEFKTAQDYPQVGATLQPHPQPYWTPTIGGGATLPQDSRLLTAWN